MPPGVQLSCLIVIKFSSCHICLALAYPVTRTDFWPKPSDMFPPLGFAQAYFLDVKGKSGKWVRGGGGVGRGKGGRGNGSSGSFRTLRILVFNKTLSLPMQVVNRVLTWDTNTGRGNFPNPSWLLHPCPLYDIIAETSNVDFGENAKVEPPR